MIQGIIQLCKRSQIVNFGSTYLCDQFFFSINIIKNCYGLATSSVHPNIKHLVKPKAPRISHRAKKFNTCLFVIFYYFTLQLLQSFA